jgi:hypothetical protein
VLRVGASYSVSLELGNGAQETTAQKDESNPADEINTLLSLRTKTDRQTLEYSMNFTFRQRLKFDR